MKRYGYFFLALMLVLTACTHKDFCYSHPHVSHVRVNVDWSDFDREQPTGMTVKVFPADGGMPYTNLVHTLDHTVFNLPEGNYHVMAFNQSPSEFGSVDFSNMDSFQEARVVAGAIPSRWYKTRTVLERVVIDPEWLAMDANTDNRVTKEMVETTRNETLAQGTKRSLTEHLLTTLTPQNVIYTVHVKMNIRGIHNLRSARAAMDGMAEGVKLSNRQPLPSKVTHLMESWKLTQDKENPIQGYITATFQCFGLPFGHQGKASENRLMMSLLLVDNKTQLHRMFQLGDLYRIDEKDGHIKLYVELDWGDGLDYDPDNPEEDPEFPDKPNDPDDPDKPDDPLPEVKPEGGSGSGFDATVEDWGEEIEHDIQM